MKEIDLVEGRKNTKEINISELSANAYSTQERLQVQEIVDEKKKESPKDDG